MGPRSGDRGNIRGCAEKIARSGRLQWGRDLVIAEISITPIPAGTTGDASMGPRSGDRGNTDASQDASDDATASMGPRSGDRGNEGRDRPEHGGDRGFNGAAIW